MKEEAFFAGRHLAVQNMRSFFFLQKLSAKIQPAIQNPGSSLRRPSPAKKSDKNLHQPKNLVYYICKREGQLLPIRQTDSPSEFLSFYVCAAALSRGLFAARRIRHTVCIKAKKRKEKILSKYHTPKGMWLVIPTGVDISNQHSPQGWAYRWHCGSSAFRPDAISAPTTVPGKPSGSPRLRDT